MITAVDTSVLLDIFLADPVHGIRSANALREAITQGQLLACGIVFAEVAAHFPTETAAAAAMKDLGVEYGELTMAASLQAGTAWREYRRAGGPRHQLVADFLIAAHANQTADRLLTRDRGFSRRWFKQLEVWDPSLTSLPTTKKGNEP